MERRRSFSRSRSRSPRRSPRAAAEPQNAEELQNAEVEEKEDEEEVVEEHKPKEEEEEEEETYNGTIHDDLKLLMSSHNLSDVVFIVGKEKERVYAHRLIMTAASPVFAAMLYPNELEAPRRGLLEVVIPDVKPLYFKGMVEAIYTDTTDLDGDKLGECVRLAKKYCVEKLQVLCADFMEDGVNAENVCGLFNNAPDTLGDENFGLAFIEEHTKEVFSTDGFLELREERLGHILKSPNLRLRESILWSFTVEWARAEAERRGLDPENGDVLRRILKPFVRDIRFPLFTMTEFSTLVNKPGLLDPEDLLELYTYIACREAKLTELPKVSWLTEPRVKLGFEFKWARCGNNSAIRENGTTHISTSGGYSCAIGDIPLEPKTGKHYWEIKVDALPPGDWQCAVGVGTSSINLNDYISSSTAGWGYFSHGCRCHNSGSSSDQYGGTYAAGATIGVLLDTDEGTLSYFRDGTALGVCFRNITQAVYPATHVNSGVALSIKRDVTPPPEAY